MRLSRSMLVAALSLVAATLFWAGNYVVGKIAVAELSPLSLVYLRWLLAVVPLFLVAQVVERPEWRLVLRAWPWLLALSFCVYSAQWLAVVGFLPSIYAGLGLPAAWTGPRAGPPKRSPSSNSSVTVPAWPARSTPWPT